MGIKIVTLCGSARPGNYTSMALNLVNDELSRIDDLETVSIDLASLNLPVPGTGKPTAAMRDFKAQVESATGVIMATPEYHGSFSSLIKLGIENLGFPSALAGKPMTLLGVAAGQIGAIKSLEHLRSVCSHVGAIVLPSLVSVANVRSVFDEKGRCLDAKAEQRIRSTATILVDYIRGAVCPAVMLESMVREDAKI